MAGAQERFGDQIRRHREAAGYSQQELAERAGMSVNAIGSLERGERKRPYPDTIRRLADALGLNDAARLALATSLHGTPPATPDTILTIPDTAVAADLPGEPTPFIGRDHELGVVRHLLAQSDGRLLTLVGPGGVGKSRLALHLARTVASDYADGAAWVELAPLSDPTLVTPTIGRALGLEEPPGGDAAGALQAWLRDRRVLLVLDNVEHLPAAIPNIAHLLVTCPRLQILATSRSPLRIRGEQEYLVPPLEIPPANLTPGAENLAHVSSVQFFVWQARQRSPSFTLTDDNAATVAAICRRLDGLPLALELVAARIRVLTPAELLARLDRPMPLLVGGARDLPQRQQTMRAAIAWSYDLLSPAAQALFRRLAVFAGGWSLAAAEAVADDAAGNVIDVLEMLAEQSMVTVTLDTDGTRYGMLEPIRQFAQEVLEGAGEAPATQRRHAEYFQDLAERAGAELEGRSGQVGWLARLEREHDNLRTALGWSRQADDGRETGLRIASALWRFWEMRWYVDEGGRWLDLTLEQSQDLSPALRAKALSAAGNLARDRTELARATTYHEQALAIRRSLNDTRGIASSLNNLGVIARDQGDADRTMHFGQDARALFVQAGDRHGEAIVLISLAMAAGMQGEYARARGYYEESLDLFRASGDDWHIAWVLLYLTDLLIDRGDIGSARPLAEESLVLHRVSGDAWGISTALGVLGRTDLAEGKLDTATTHFAEALRLVIRAQVDRAIPSCLEDLATVMLARGHLESAAWMAGATASLRSSAASSDAVATSKTIRSDLDALADGPHAAAWTAGRSLGRQQIIAEAWDLADTMVSTHDSG